MHLIIPPQQQSGYPLRAVVFTGNACGLDTQASIYSTPLFPAHWYDFLQLNGSTFSNLYLLARLAQSIKPVTGYSLTL
jgi:hypothetical protein